MQELRANVETDIDDINESLINKFNISNLFGKKVLENIQEKISRATGLAFVTVDYKGDPITEMTSFTGFCNQIRKSETGLCACKASDALGGIQAAVTKKNYIYFCPHGLMETAIPIIVRGHYLGAFIGGQARCFNPPDNITKFENVINHLSHYKEDERLQKLKQKVQVYDYNKFINIVELVALVMNQLGEKEAHRLVQKDALKMKVYRLKNLNKNLEIENKLKNIEIMNLKAESDTHFLIGVLNSISSLTVIENAPRTNEMIVMFAEYLKHTLGSDRRYKRLEEEVESAELYLKIQKVKYGELLSYEINMDNAASTRKIPADILMPFVQNAVFYGVASNMQGGKVKINVYLEEKDIVVCIEDNGPGLSGDQVLKKFRLYKGNYEGESIQIGMESARKRLVTLFGENYDVLVEKSEGKGTKIVIRCPLKLEERIV